MNKIIPFENLNGNLRKLQNQKLVLVGGCFDILHAGHIEFLNAARKQGEKLLVILESDESVRSKKGAGRPINDIKTRASLLAALPVVDYILLLPYFKTDLEYYNLVKKIEPDIIAVTASDAAYNKKLEQAKLVGGRVVEVIKRLPQHSTTSLSENIKN